MATKGKGSPQKGVRFPPDQLAKLEARAAAEERQVSWIVRRAVAIYLAGGANEYAEAMRRMAEEDLNHLTPEQRSLRDAAEWLLSLPVEIRAKLAEFGEGLRLAYEARTAGRREVETRLGRVLNILQVEDTPSSSARGGRLPRKRPSGGGK